MRLQKRWFLCGYLMLWAIAVFHAESAIAVTVLQTNFSDKSTVQPTDEIRIRLDQLPTAAEGKLAIFLGQTDVTSLFQVVDRELVYQARLLPLAIGETQLILYLVK